jgi:hypothetical protein
MNKKEYLTKLANRVRVSFYILLAITIYEIWYWFGHGGGLSFVLILLAGAVTFFAYTLMRLFDDMKDNS